jgi:formylglycine-generating enzyme required for sulfatase activity
MRFVLIPSGTFLMGSPHSERGRWSNEEQHEVEISRPFYLGVYEVTQKQYQTIMGSNPSYFSKEAGGKASVAGMNTDDFPVERVSWDDAQAFLKKLSELPAEKKARRVYRLPTEAEWEYACRGGASSYQVFHTGNSLTSTQANFDGNNYGYGGADKGPYLKRTCKVGSYRPNAFGLYDMHGNVWEWCSDWKDEDYYRKSPRRDPAGPAKGLYRVLRGGGWSYGDYTCRSAHRTGSMPVRGSSYGFRAALVLSE